jgi:membrane protease YdiL (CAAX protease family)
VALASVPMRVLPSIVYQLGYAAAYEEPIFRGLLWGYLRLKGWKDAWILLLQAGLFWLGHSYYIGKAPFSFWVLLPAAGLLFGLLAWRSRSIATSMAAHGVINGTGMLLGNLLAGYVF